MLEKRFYWIFPLVLFSVLLFTISCEEDDEALTYDLSIIVSPEQGGTAEGSGNYKEGEDVPVSADANDGYEFFNWTDERGDVVSSEEDYTFIMPSEDVVLTANYIIIIEDGTEGTVTDIDNNEYKTVYIGGKEWMAENLRTARYKDGTELPGDLSGEDWGNTIDGAYAVYPHEDVDGIGSEAEMVDAYGKLYNWRAVDDDRGLCPEGWHVPSVYDWDELVNYIMENYEDIEPFNVGDMLKSCRQVDSRSGGDCVTDEHPRWDADKIYGIDKIGFSALPGGSRHSYGDFGENVGKDGRFWNSTETSSTEAARWYIEYDSSLMNWGGSVYKEAGLSVRCVKSRSR